MERRPADRDGIADRGKPFGARSPFNNCCSELISVGRSCLGSLYLLGELSFVHSVFFSARLT
jgi:hypothetical protein